MITITYFATYFYILSFCKLAMIQNVECFLQNLQDICLCCKKLQFSNKNMQRLL